jgi:hypothetical protein
LLALGVGIASGTASYLLLRASPAYVQGADFTFTWLAAKAVLRGVDPYVFVRHNVTPPWAHEYFYPLPAAFAGIPFAWMPVQLAAAIFVAVECAVLALFITRLGYWRLAMFVSAPIFQVLWSPQWSPLVTAAALTPPLLGILACKPQFALPLIGYQRSRRAVLVGVLVALVVAAISLVIEPEWPARWIAVLRSAPVVSQYRVPMLSAWAPLLLLPALRWRRPEARLLLGMALVPQNMFFYDQLPLLLIPETRRELVLAVAASLVAYMIPFLVRFGPMDIAGRSAAFTPLVMLGMYGPAIALVLMRPTTTSQTTRLSRLRHSQWIAGGTVLTAWLLTSVVGISDVAWSRCGIGVAIAGLLVAALAVVIVGVRKRRTPRS